MLHIILQEKILLNFLINNLKVLKEVISFCFTLLIIFTYMKNTFMIKTYLLCRWNSLFPEKMSLPVLFSLWKNGKYWEAGY